MGLFLGIDGGGTGCRAAVADREGRVLGRGQGGSANIWTDPEGALASILAAAGSAAEEAGVEPARLVAVLGLAGANMAGAGERLAGRLPFASVRIETDAVVALKGAVGAGDGITATLGTGSVFGVQRAGRTRIVGGWGFLLGDQGSGARIGRALLEAALLAHDAAGRGSEPRFCARCWPPTAAPRALSPSAGGRRRQTSPARCRGCWRRTPPAIRPRGRSCARRRRRSPRPSTGCRRRGRCRSHSSAGSGRSSPGGFAGRYPGMIRPPLGGGLDGALAMARGLA